LSRRLDEGEILHFVQNDLKKKGPDSRWSPAPSVLHEQLSPSGVIRRR
jgi:hypothetical protein